jgi:predicted dehydrogenase
LPDTVKAVSLAVPTTQHAVIGSHLLAKGINVLVEKPIAVTLREADDLIEAEKEGGAILLVGHSERYNPAFRSVVPYVTTPRFFEGHRLGVFVSRSLDVDVVLDLMIHDLDLVLWLAGQQVKDIRAVGIPVLTDKIDIANARVEFENGCVANLTASRVSRERVRKLRFFQPGEYISIDLQDHDSEMFSLDLGAEKPGIVQKQIVIEKKEPLLRELEEFIEAVEGRIPQTACTGKQGRQVLAVALAVLEGMQTV